MTMDLNLILTMFIIHIITMPICIIHTDILLIIILGLGIIITITTIITTSLNRYVRNESGLQI